MWLNPFVRRGDSYMLLVSMTGVKLGDRVAFIGCAHGGRLASVAAKVGLSGRAVAIAPDESSAARAQRGAEDVGVLVEVEIAPPTRLPLEDAAFDLAVIDDTQGLFGTMAVDERALAIHEAARILRPGGRTILVGATPAGGLGRLIARSQPVAPFGASADANKALETNGFGVVRTLAEREGLVFVEGIKPRAKD
jgi:ubiquinone/menaquinone biosynthesis C-methylase UbiE